MHMYGHKAYFQCIMHMYYRTRPISNKLYMHMYYQNTRPISNICTCTTRTQGTCTVLPENNAYFLYYQTSNPRNGQPMWTPH